LFCVDRSDSEDEGLKPSPPFEKVYTTENSVSLPKKYPPVKLIG
jgi:hypothetical protein